MPQSHFKRYALYHVPSDALGDLGAGWLGWDCRRGVPVANPVSDGWTRGARRYGFHATLKAPFRLADTETQFTLEAAAARVATQTAPVRLEGLAPRWLGRFLALVPLEQSQPLSDLAARCVMELDRFRAAPTSQDSAKYASRPLNPELQDNLQRWGYPYIFDAFRFHLTLTDRLHKSERGAVDAALPNFAPLTQPYRLDHMSLVGEDAEGRFHELNRYALTAPPDGSDR